MVNEERDEGRDDSRSGAALRRIKLVSSRLQNEASPHTHSKSCSISQRDLLLSIREDETKRQLVEADLERLAPRLALSNGLYCNYFSLESPYQIQAGEESDAGDEEVGVVKRLGQCKLGPEGDDVGGERQEDENYNSEMIWLAERQVRDSVIHPTCEQGAATRAEAEQSSETSAVVRMSFPRARGYTVLFQLLLHLLLLKTCLLLDVVEQPLVVVLLGSPTPLLRNGQRLHPRHRCRQSSDQGTCSHPE